MYNIETENFPEQFSDFQLVSARFGKLNRFVQLIESIRFKSQIGMHYLLCVNDKVKLEIRPNWFRKLK